ncbi:MAG: MFS transporter [Jiangellaceae bacterium]|nr:MFS transporter [Jiangellaceae bacterium]
MLVLLVHAVLTQALTFVLRPTVSYRALELDVDAAWLGLLSASFALVPLVIAIPSGHAVDRFGERKVMLVGGGVLLASGLCFTLLGGSVAGLVAASVLLGTGHLFSVVAEQATVANTAAPGRYDTSFGHYTFAVSLGQSLGPSLIILVGGDDVIPNTADIFLSCTVLAAALLGVTPLIPRLRHVGAKDHAAEGGIASLLRVPGMARAIITSCLVLAAVDIALVYLPALGEQRGLPSSAIALLLTCRAVSSMTVRLFLGRLAQWVGRRSLLVSTVLMSAAGLAAIPVPMPLWTMILLVILAGLGLGAAQPLTMSWVAEQAPRGQRGRAMSLRLTGNRLGQVLVPSVVGTVAAGLGAAGVLWVTAGCLFWVGLAARTVPFDRR